MGDEREGGREMKPNELIYNLITEWDRRIAYLEDVIKLEEKYYPEKKSVTDVVYARLEELRERELELQRVLNNINSNQP
jgi:hypothetical protein